MKITHSWLRDHLDTEASLDEITARLTAIGLEVENVTDPGQKLKSFVIARVLDAKPHPNADRLRVCQVDTGAGVVEVVCGAPNARAGMTGVFAPLGSYIPGTGITLEKRPVRGVVSNGMLLSERELELSDDHDGIIDLGSESADKVGTSYAEVMGLDDPVIDVKLTPNRPDCTGVRGIARDLAAAGIGKLRPEPKHGDVEGDYDCPIDIRLEFPKEAEDACPMFAGRYLRDVRNGASPKWMQARLKAVGLRPISALVDVTNYISLDRGRPLHVYDADKLVGALRARLGNPGEEFIGLDGKSYKVDGEMCVIADDNGPVGLGGIIGGVSTGCTEATRNVLLECAYFDPLRTAATGRRAGVQTDARYRFERGADPAFVRPGLDLGTEMLMQVSGGQPSRARVAGKAPSSRTVVGFDIALVKRLAGIEVKDAEARKILSDLGFEVAGRSKKVQVTAPSWRPDVHGDADLVEEIVRIVGIDKVPSTPMSRPHGVARPVLTDKQRRVRRGRRVLAARGFTEVVTWSFIPKAQAELFGGGMDALDLANPISTEMTSMRPSLLPGLLTAAQRNRNRGFADAALFELGQAYRGDRPEDQHTIAAGVRIGTSQAAGSGRHWRGTATAADVFDVKADVMATLQALGVDGSKAQIVPEAPPWLHPGKSAALRLGPKTVLARFGEVHPDALRSLDVAGSASVFEIYLDALPPEKRKARAKPALTHSELLPVRRDLAFLVADGVHAGDILRAAARAGQGIISDLTVFDVFSGSNLESGKKSIALEIVLDQKDRTLTDAEIEAVIKRVAIEVAKATGGELRA